jgi:DNA adenine methylase
LTRLVISKLPRPFLKWAGGKRWALEALLPTLEKPGGTYFEPFLGAGSVFLALDPSITRVGGDTNSQLIETWTAVRDDLPKLVEELNRFDNSSETYYEVRAWDRDQESFAALSPTQRAARLIYLNKTCFNGLYRVNRQGQFNVPFGDYKNPNFRDIEALQAASDLLNSTGPSLKDRATLLNSGYIETVGQVGENDVVYFDPPYEPLNSTSSFVSYQGAGFNQQDQRELRDIALELVRRGARVVVSNSSAAFIFELYGSLPEFRIVEIDSNRSISASKGGRGSVTELLIVGDLK